MTRSPTHRDGELLSAYLAGDLDDREAARLEARLVREPELAARLEATRVVVEGLARLDAVEPPSGFGERLRSRIADERRESERGEGQVESPVALADARARRTQWLRERWPVLGAAAAGVVGVALVAAVAFGTLSPGDVMVADEPAAEEPELEAFEADQDVVEEAPLEADAPARAALPEPVLRDTQVPLDDADDVREHLEGTPVESLLGLPVEAAADVAAAFTVAVQRAEPFASGPQPGVCLDAVTAGAEQPVVPGQVEAVLYDGADALLYVTATARGEADALDRIEAWMVEPQGCVTRLYVEL